MGLFDEIREGCRWVCEQATHVRVASERLDAYATSLLSTRLDAPSLDPDAHYLGHGEDTASFFVVLDTINFGSGYFPHLRKLPNRSGYFTIATHLASHYRKHGVLSAESLAGLTADGCTDLFGQRGTGPVVGELMTRFAQALNALGTLLCERYGGRATALLEAADARAERLVELLRAMPFFNDLEPYRGRPVPFFKRSQLLAADLGLAFGGHDWGAFRDLDRLTIFADNLVPHVLRVDGVLQYDPRLLARIERGVLIEAGSPEEIELRAAAVHAVDLLAQRMRPLAPGITEQRLDYLLWNRGQSRRYKAIPRHRTRTVFY